MSRQREFKSGVKRKRLHGSGSEPLSVELEEKLLAWIYDNYEVTIATKTCLSRISE